jgi:hypothetical protein
MSMYDLALLLTGAMLMLDGVWMLPLPLLLLDVLLAPAQHEQQRRALHAAEDGLVLKLRTFVDRGNGDAGGSLDAAAAAAAGCVGDTCATRATAQGICMTCSRRCMGVGVDRRRADAGGHLKLLLLRLLLYPAQHEQQTSACNAAHQLVLHLMAGRC